MIDNFALGLTHLLMMIAAVILLRRSDLDREPSARPGAAAKDGPLKDRAPKDRNGA